MFKLPDFPSVDFSKFDVDALRNIDVPTIDVAKVTETVRDLAYLAVGLGITATNQVREIIRNAA
jgi:hypothetical protein